MVLNGSVHRVCPRGPLAAAVSVGVPSWAFTIPWEERLVDFGGYKTWVREVGKRPGSVGGLFGLFGKSADKSKG